MNMQEELVQFLGTKYFKRFIKELRRISITTANNFIVVGSDLYVNKRIKKYYEEYIDIVYTIKVFDEKAITKIDNFIYDYQEKYEVNF
ncbi:MAG: hypothetical protein J6574_03960 [Gilliamella sp.]|nr:hypothetical protein [Gilliamella sp.]